MPHWWERVFRDGRSLPSSQNPEAFSVLEANFQRLEIKGQALRRAVNAMGDDLHFRGRTIVAPSTPDAIIVSGVRFDDMHTRGSRRPAKIVKIDVHGAEGLVLDGMREALIKVVTGLLVENPCRTSHHRQL